MGLFVEGGGCLKSVLVVGHIPVRTFLQENYFFDAAHTSNRTFFKGKANFR